MPSSKNSRPFRIHSFRSPFQQPGLLVPAVLAAGLLLVFSGCRTIDQDWDKPSGSAFVPTNYYQKGPMPPSVRRVAVLPLFSKEWDHVDLNDFQQTFATELSLRNEFEVVVVLPERMNAIFGQDEISSVEPITSTEFAALVQQMGADAVLFTDLTSYSPYRPIVMGVRCKLIDARNADVLWAFDTVFDSGNPSVSTAARRFHSDEAAPPYPLQNSSSILQSPLRYSKYVADATFSTIPER